MQADAYIDKRLLRPLGIRGWRWSRDRAGTTVAYAELSLRPRDLARIGQLVADGGRVGRKTILSPEAIASLCRPATGLRKDQGLLWRLLLREGTGEITGVYHTGWLGQWLVVLPAERLVAVRLRRFEDERENGVRAYEMGGLVRLLRATLE